MLYSTLETANWNRYNCYILLVMVYTVSIESYHAV